jgi:8-oxo-dGTP diphosphatase
MQLPKHHVAAAGIVINGEGQILLIQRADNGRWEPPGGVVELEDGLEEAVIREVKEESHVDVRVERLVGVYKSIGRRDTHVVSLVFLCRPIGGHPEPGDETVAAGYYSREKAMKLVTRELMRDRLRDAFANQAVPFVRDYRTPGA